MTQQHNYRIGQEFKFSLEGIQKWNDCYKDATLQNLAKVRYRLVSCQFNSPELECTCAPLGSHEIVGESARWGTVYFSKYLEPVNLTKARGHHHPLTGVFV